MVNNILASRAQLTGEVKVETIFTISVKGKTVAQVIVDGNPSYRICPLGKGTTTFSIELKRMSE